ncbi:hypothetical protein [Bremerella sp.]|uniref:hypothetical protein n=1 Tax=Bremerella sp. TaxID=2795602 RepID=UPI00391C0A90
MTDADQQRLQELQALTQASSDAHSPVPITSTLLQTAQHREPDEAADEDSPQPSPSPPAEEDATSVPILPGIAPLPTLLARSPVSSPSTTQASDLASRVQQTAATTLQLRDQREFKVSLEEDPSRDDALVQRLAEQTVAFVQQRDEAIYQRVMQAIEQRLAQGRNAIT